MQQALAEIVRTGWSHPVPIAEFRSKINPDDAGERTHYGLKRGVRDGNIHAFQQAMPIYEFYSPDTNKIYSFFARSLSVAGRVPRCPDKPKAKMEKVVSRFAVTGKAKEETAGGGDDAMDPRMERVMADMEREMAGIDENNPDPRLLGRLMRKMTEATGKKVPEEMEQMLRRLESGEDPEKLEEEFGGALDEIGEGAFGLDEEGGESASKKARARRPRPKRDPRLYEYSDYLD